MPSRSKSRGLDKPDPRVAFAQFCDDIRFEVGSKLSFMGIYGQEMRIAAPFPVLLPRFGIHVGLISDIGDLPAFVSVSIIAPDGEEIIRTETPIAGQHIDRNESGVTKYRFMQSRPISPLPLPYAGYLEVWVQTEKDKLRAGRLKIVSVEPSNLDPIASPPPA